MMHGSRTVSTIPVLYRHKLVVLLLHKSVVLPLAPVVLPPIFLSLTVPKEVQ